MALSYAPFDDPVAPRPPSYIQKVAEPRTIERDATECNYLIMFFVAGVFLLGLADAMR